MINHRTFITQQESLKQSRDLTKRELANLRIYLKENYQDISQNSNFDELSDLRYCDVRQRKTLVELLLLLSFNRLRRFIVTGEDVNRREKTTFIKYLKDEKK